MRIDSIVCGATLAGMALVGSSLEAQTSNQTPQVDERELFMSAARTAWAFVNRNYQPASGLARAHDTYQYVTLWDVGSAIAAHYSAHELGLLPDATYNQRMQRMLATIASMDLFDKAAFNKSYDSKTGKMIDRNQRKSARGYGWSTTDIGRLLIWLRIVAVNQPQFAGQADAIVKRLDVSRLINNGYLQGTDIDPSNGQLRVYPEGRMGYEQYAAAGLALWGFRAENALSATLNALPVTVLGVTLNADKRGNERITSEPYIMMGLETGWYSLEMREQALRVLAAQEARYKATGTLTMASEDALPDPPYYFYYYNIYRQGRSFVVDAQGGQGFVESPRWISSKAAFAWRALVPSEYTLAAVQAVQPAAVPGRGWGAGVYERSRKSTGGANLNTAALILEAAVYHMRGRPFLNGQLQK